MPLNFDETNPADDASIPAYPANERAFRAQVKTFVEVEHHSDEGRHAFGLGNSTARDAIVTWGNGSIFFRNDVVSGEVTLQRYTGSAWQDVGPPANIPRLGSQSSFTVCQFAQWVEVTPSSGTGPGGVDEVAINLALSPNKWATIVADTEISNPVNPVSGYGTVVQLELVMDGTGGHTVTFDSNYRSASGVAPVVTSTASARTMLYLSYTRDGLVLVSSTPGFAAIT